MLSAFHSGEPRKLWSTFNDFLGRTRPGSNGFAPHCTSWRPSRPWSVPLMIRQPLPSAGLPTRDLWLIGIKPGHWIGIATILASVSSENLQHQYCAPTFILQSSGPNLVCNLRGGRGSRLKKNFQVNV